MSCEPLRPLLAGHVDGALTADEAARVEEHLAGCGTCRADLQGLRVVARGVAEALGAPAPSAEAWAEWSRELDARLVVEPDPATRRRWVPGWAATFAAAAGLLAAAWFAAWAFEPPISLAGTKLPNPSLEYRDPELLLRPRVTPPTAAEVAGLAEAPLSPAAREALARDGLVQVPDGRATLLEHYPPAEADGPLPLVTADVALLVHGGAAARAAASVEATLLAPGLRTLLATLCRELRALEVELRSAELRAAARLARERLGVAALLVTVDPRLEGPALRRAQADAERVRSGRGLEWSEVLGRELDTRRLQPAGLHAAAPALREHARAVRWLATTGLAVGADGPGEARAACLVTLALARARLPDQRPALALQARLEAAVEVLYGEPDELTPLDLLGAVRQAVGAPEVRPSLLARGDVLARVVERAQALARARGAGRVRSLGEGAPRMSVLGNTRSLEARVLSRLTGPAVPGRDRGTSLDLLGLLGSATARGVAASLPGSEGAYEGGLAELGAALAPWREPAREVPLRASLERGRAWAIAALVDRDEPLPFVRPLRYRSRALLAALAGLNAPPAPSWPAPSAAAPDVVPAVEPAPRTYGRLAFAARRLRDALAQTAPAPRPRQVEASLAGLTEVARHLDALRAAAQATARGEPLGEDTARELRRFRQVIARHAPAAPASVEELYELASPGAPLEVLHRLTTRVDRLWLIVPDARTGRPRLAGGPALTAGERWVAGARLTVDDLTTAPDPTPSWARHVLSTR